MPRLLASERSEVLRRYGAEVVWGPCSAALGPSALTLRDARVPLRWAGLVAADRGLLQRFLSRLGRAPDELHTHVPVGRAPWPASGVDDFARRQIESCWARRIDALLRFGSEWWLVECKPSATHHVLGQVLCYVYWLTRDRPDLELARVLVVTDWADPELLPVLGCCGVGCVEVLGLYP